MGPFPIIAMFGILSITSPEPSKVLAEEPALRCGAIALRYDAPQLCPDQRYVCDRLIERSATTPEVVIAASLRLHIDKERLRGTLELKDAAGQSLGSRMVPSSPLTQCAPVVRAMASAIATSATMLASSATNSPSSPVAPQPPEKSPQPRLPVKPTKEVVVKPGYETPETALEWTIGLGLSHAWAPATTWGPRAGLMMRQDWWSIGIDSRLELSLGQSTIGEQVEVNVTIMGAGPLACAHLSVTFLCFDTFAGAYRSNAELVDAALVSDFIAALGGRVGVELMLVPDSIWSRLWVEAHLPLVLIDMRASERSLWQSPPVNLGFNLGLGGNLL